jgi:hypothetical protein
MTDATAEGGTYVLQVQDALPDPADGRERWKDVATITVAPRTKRKTAIRRALEESGIEITGELDRKVRLLDAESAEVRTVRPRPPAAPELEIV